MIYQTKVNAQAFSTTFTFSLNGQCLAFVIQNNTNSDAGGTGSGFAGGAGDECAFFQGFSANHYSTNNLFAFELDSYSALTENGGGTPFTYSSEQIYQQQQNPGTATGGPIFYETNKISTSPVPLDSPSTTQDTCVETVSGKCDTYSVTLNYTGTTLTSQLHDVTAGGSCPGSSCFTYTWPNFSIPAWVGATTAYVGLTAGTGLTSSYPLNIYSVVYSVLTPAATPTFSPAAGTYSGTQSVTISDATGSNYICYNFTGGPATNGIGGCANGTLYSGAISVPSGRTIYAVAGVAGTYGDSTVASAAYNITGTGSVPVFNQPGGTWQGNQTVQLTAAQGSVICYSTTGSPATNGGSGCTTGTLYTTPITLSSNKTIYAVAGGTGLTDSAVGSAAYVISPFAGTAPVAAPTFSPVPGTYSSTQTVTISTTTSGANICYELASSTPTLLPEPNSIGGCTVGTLYSSPVSVPSSQTLYAAAGPNVVSAPLTSSAPSSVVQGAYTIGSSAQAPGAPTITGASAVPQ